jgi:hypothetical protein
MEAAAYLRNGGSCFHKDALFLKNGTTATPVSELDVGDLVAVWSENAGTPVLSSIIGFSVRPSDLGRNINATLGTVFVHLYTDDGSVSVTDKHYVEVLFDSENKEEVTAYIQNSWGRYNASGTELFDDGLVAIASVVFDLLTLLGEQKPLYLPSWNAESLTVVRQRIATWNRTEEYGAAYIYMPVTLTGLSYVLASGSIIPMEGVITRPCNHSAYVKRSNWF